MENVLDFFVGKRIGNQTITKVKNSKYAIAILNGNTIYQSQYAVYFSDKMVRTYNSLEDIPLNPSFDHLINEFVLEVRKYYKHYPGRCRTTFEDDFPDRMRNEWKDYIEELENRLEYFRYLNKKREEGVFL